MNTGREKPALEVTRLIFRESVKSFQSNRNMEISAALATYGFFAFLPLLFLLGYLFGNYAVFSKKVVQGIDHLIILMFPRTEPLISREKEGSVFRGNVHALFYPPNRNRNGDGTGLPSGGTLQFYYWMGGQIRTHSGVHRP